jgi:hypothetical protein
MLGKRPTKTSRQQLLQSGCLIGSLPWSMMWPILDERADHAAYVASVELAFGKAQTAALFKKPSQQVYCYVTPGGVQWEKRVDTETMKREGES